MIIFSGAAERSGRGPGLFWIKGKPAPIRVKILLATVMTTLIVAGCADDQCLSHPPAFEVKVEWQATRSVSQVSVLMAEITAAGLTKEVSLEIQPLRTRGWISFVVEVGSAGDPGFIGVVNLEARDGEGTAIARGEQSFDGSGDACNFLEIPLSEITCAPSCDGKACGADDGCGSACQSGVCADGQRCVEGACTCDATTCPTGCCHTGACFPGTSDDHCGGGGASCGDCLAESKACSGDQVCISCTPQCEGKSCGAENGCGGTCSGGNCPAGQLCEGGHCVCNAGSCENGCCGADSTCKGGNDDAFCGNDGALCSSCSTPAQVCRDQSCQDCLRACTGNCDLPDGCGGTCGCDGDEVCESNICVPVECRRCVNDQAYGENTTQSSFTDCNTMCTFFGAPSGVCAFPGSDDGRQCCDCQNKTSGATPQGFLDSVTGGLAKGWTCDPDDPWESLTVHIYVGGITSSFPRYPTLADRGSGDIIAGICGGGYYHRFQFQIPNWSSFVGMPIYAYGLNVQGGDNKLLTNSGMLLQ